MMSKDEIPLAGMAYMCPAQLTFDPAPTAQAQQHQAAWRMGKVQLEALLQLSCTGTLVMWCQQHYKDICLPANSTSLAADKTLYPMRLPQLATALP